MKKCTFIILQVIEIIATSAIAYISIGLYPCHELKILKQNNMNVTITGNRLIVLLWLTALVLSIVFCIKGSIYICTPKTKEKCKNIFSKADMQERYKKALMDCQEVIILVKHLDYLKTEKDQMKRIKELGQSCTIICFNVSENNSIMQDLKENQVNVCTIQKTEDISNLKGQVILGPLQSSILIQKKKDEKFELLMIDNIYIQNIIIERITNFINNYNNRSV